MLKEAGISGVCALGNTSEPICQIAVGLNRVGMVLLGGLNRWQQQLRTELKWKIWLRAGSLTFSSYRASGNSRANI